ncbi:MAG: T9SS C-terminal target domain-containing protein, partial [Bacteroidia bacterium]|nr:T9SS C-terminal target domain-containing protein [Bacteroidia bacterium]
MIQCKKFSVLIAVVFIAGLFSAQAKEDVAGKNVKSTHANNANKVALNCSQTTSQTDLAINNVRTTIQVGGDMWWDLVNPQYEIPAGSGLHSLYAGALWIGGVDDGGQIKVAAQTYRQTGVDFWGGPINTATVDIDPAECVKYDRHWQISKEEVAEFRDKLGTGGYVVPNAIQTWPGNGDPTKNQAQFLAPFTDINGDGFYDWTAGDHPKYDFEGGAGGNCSDFLFGDETVWWVFNDVGNVHTESNSILPLGLEIRAQGFGFKTNDEINNMTFYKYEIINRSFQSLNNTYFGQWVDPDLGNAADDYVGCDVARGLGYCFNGDADDETVTGYGLNPPAVGVDFFQGPLADPNDGVDNDRDGEIDEVGEEIIMSKFVYYNNVNSTPDGNPNGFADFYSYLQGIWLDNQPITYGGTGRDPNAPICDFMFPNATDPAFAGTPWTEAIAGNVPADRRFLQSAGPFTLLPGAVNYVTTGIVWARAGAGGNLASISLIQAADDKAQSLFDNCFKLVDGPDAPDLVIRELDQTLIFTLENTNNQFIEQYEEVDPTISTQFFSDNKFRFEGFQIYQLASDLVTINEQSIADPDQIRLLAQVDLDNNIGK